jgi:hypothetical protein
MAETELSAFVRPGTYSHDDRGEGGRKQTPESVANRTYPRLVEMFLDILRESGFREHIMDHHDLPRALRPDRPEELEGDEYYVDVIDIPTKEVVYGESEQRKYIREYTILFSRGSVTFCAEGKLLTVE